MNSTAISCQHLAGTWGTCMLSADALFLGLCSIRSLPRQHAMLASISLILPWIREGTLLGSSQLPKPTFPGFLFSTDHLSGSWYGFLASPGVFFPGECFQG